MIVSHHQSMAPSLNHLLYDPEAFDPNAWNFKMTITGPGRNVNIHGNLIPRKRPAEEDLSPRPFTFVRQFDTMVGDGGKHDDLLGSERGPEEVEEAEEEDNQTQPFDTVLDTQEWVSQWVHGGFCSGACSKVQMSHFRFWIDNWAMGAWTTAVL